MIRRESFSLCSLLRSSTGFCFVICFAPRKPWLRLADCDVTSRSTKREALSEAEGLTSTCMALWVCFAIYFRAQAYWICFTICFAAAGASVSPRPPLTRRRPPLRCRLSGDVHTVLSLLHQTSNWLGELIHSTTAHKLYKLIVRRIFYCDE